jgi:competence ComEA-like helix-hairpin-helix protein
VIRSRIPALTGRGYADDSYLCEAIAPSRKGGDSKRVRAAILFSLLLTAFAVGAIAQSLPDGAGKELVEVICSSCHDTVRITTKHWSKEEWAGKVLEMLQEEPDVTQPERDRIVDYLAKSFPRLAPVNVNKASSKDLESALSFAAKEADAIVHYRQENGNFKNVADLKKVPGLDPAKVDALKERLEF